MERYFETIGGRDDGIVGSAAGFFWVFLVVRKSFSKLFCLFLLTFLFFLLSLA